MAKQRTDYKNRDNSKTNIRQYVDVYIRIRVDDNCIVPPASTQPRADGATHVRLLYGQPVGIPVIFDAAANPVLHEENEVKKDYVREWMSGAFAYRLVRKVIGALTVLACCGAVHCAAAS